MNARSKGAAIARLKRQQRKDPKRIISLLLVISMLCGNFMLLPSSAAEMVAYCGKEEHTHSDACYLIEETPAETEAAGETETTAAAETTAAETEAPATTEAAAAEAEETTNASADSRVQLLSDMDSAETLGAASEEETQAAETEAEEKETEPAETEAAVEGSKTAETLAAASNVTVSETPVCGKEVHVHTLQCYSNPNADVETAAIWEATLPEKLSGDWGKDLAEVAKSQLGYAESAANYLVGADGETLMGYSRYGAWYSSYTQDEKQAYADWNVPFLFFCLYYAGVEDFPIEEDCADWTAALAAAQLWREAAGEYIPEAGDLVFLDTDEDGAADRAAVVTDWDEAKVTAVESDSEGAVKTVTYDLTEDTQVLGYGDTNEAQAQIEVSGGEDAETLAATGTGISGYIGNSFSNGGTFYLSGDAWTEKDSNYADLRIDCNTTIDLNGHKLTISKTDQAFHVTDGATLTILDSSKTVTPTIINEYQISGTNSDDYGKLATMSGSVLTYYVTVPSIQADRISTKETVVQYQADLSSLGSIVGAGGDYAIYCDNGNLTINNGYITNGGGKHAICVKTDANAAQNNSQTVNINGGYICGTTGTEKGGGIYFGGGTLNISGGVIAANKASNAGGGVYFEDGYLNISGNAVISGNQADNYGGGLYVYNAYPFNMTGGYVTNNRTTTYCGDAKNDHGGGGIHVRNYEFNFQGGYVTGNYSEEAGGGVFVGRNYDGDITSARFHMTGGIVASNYTRGGEGGGIRITWGTTGKIEADASDPLYITNNVTATEHDWGGGGIFVQENGTLNIMNTLITNNSSGGYGGGVGACPTGKTLIVHTEGAAIYDNTSSGTEMSGGSNGKNADMQIAKDYFGSSFKKYEDYFCVRSKDNANDDITLVTGEMIGNGAANWSGMRDDKESVDISKTGSMAAKYLFALSADPDEAAKAAAVDAAGVIITGNHSSIHGGGIMTNGGLIIGRTSEVVYAPPSLEIQGKKVLMVGNTSQNTELDFEFELVDSLEANAKVIGTAKANLKTGVFTIYPEDAKHTAAGTFTYYLREKNDERTGVTYDTTVYQIDVTITSSEVTLMGIRFVSFNVSSVSVSRVGDDDSSGDSSATETVDNTFKIHYKNTNNWGTVSLHIWNDEGVLGGETTFPGHTLPVDTNSTNSSNGWYTKVFNNVTTSGDFEYIFSNNRNNQTRDLSGEYGPGKELWVYADTTSVTERPSDYVSDSSGTVVDSNLVTQSTKSDGTILLTFQKTAFTNTKNLPLELKFIKTDGGSQTLAGATFNLKASDGTLDKNVSTGSDGVAHFKDGTTGLPRGTTYYLYETKAPTGYAAAGPWIIELGSNDTATIFPAKETTPGGALQKTSTTGTTMGKTTENDAIVLVASIANKELTGLELYKYFKDASNTTQDLSAFPEDYTFRLERKQPGKDWETVPAEKYSVVGPEEREGVWVFQYSDMDKTGTSDDGTSFEWQYRVVELYQGKKVEIGGTAGDYKVIYTNVDDDSNEVDAAVMSGEVLVQTITNQQQPKINISVTKVWNTLNNVDKPNVTVRLEKKVNNNWVMVADVTDQTLSADNQWTYTFEDLPEKDNETTIEYRVVELQPGENGSTTVIEEGGTYCMNGVEYKVTYGSAPDTENSDQINWTITNTIVPKVQLKIIKEATSGTINVENVKFMLEKQVLDQASNETWETVESAYVPNGSYINDLTPGTYRLTEIQTDEGYNLLASPITIVIEDKGDGVYEATVNGSNESIGFSVDSGGLYTLSFTVYNKPQLVMPPTGGVGGFEFWILGGLCFIAVPLLLYTFTWYKKGGKYRRD